MTVCSAYNCGNRQGVADVTFHKFPLDKPSILHKWLTAMRKPKWVPTKEHFLCSQHFTNDMFIERSGYRFLRYDAVPTKFHVMARPKSFFPTEWPTRILTVKEIEAENAKGAVIEARVGLENREKFLEWLKAHENVSKVDYRLIRDYPKIPGKNLMFKSEYKCRFVHVNAGASSGKSCPARLLVRIRSTVNTKFKPNEDDSNLYPCTVVLYHLHDHNIASNIPDAASELPSDVSEEVKQKYIEMFKGAYTPEFALSTHQNDLLDEFVDEYEELLTDHYVCPKLEWLQNFYSTFVQNFGEWNEEKILNALEKDIEKVNSDKGKAKMLQVDSDVIVALCTPLMQRAHSLKAAGEIVFIDSSGLISQCKCYVYVLMAYSCAEGLPLGIIIATSDSESVITAGLKLLTEILPEKAFGQYGKKQGPEVFLTADSDAEQNGVKIAFPESTILLCSYSLLHALWKWLWDSENKIEESDRCTLFSLTHKIMKTKSAEEYTECHSSILQNEIVKKYENYQIYLKELCDKSSRWAVCFKNEIVDKDKEISAVEMASLVLKDKVFLTKAYNISQLLQFLANDLEMYYQHKIIYSINNTLDKFLQSSYKPEMRIIEDLETQVLPTGQYKVQHAKSGKTYFVDMDIRVCSCPLGMIGARCKHQYTVSIAKKLDLTGIVPDEETIKKELHWIATNSMNSLFGSMDPESSEGEEEVVDFEVANDDEDYKPEQDSERPNKTGKPKGTRKGAAAVLNQKQEAKGILDRMVKDIMQKYDLNPSGFHKAIITAAVNYQNLDNSNQILAALRNFANKSYIGPMK